MYKQKQIQTVLNLTVVGMSILTFISWFIYEDITPVSEAVLTALLKTIKTFVFGIDFDFTTTPPLLKLAAFAAPLCMASTIVFKMVKHVRLVFTGLLIRFFCRNHIILAGSPEFCKALLARGEKVGEKIVVLLSSEYESGQEEFEAFPVYTLCSNLFETRSWKRAGLKRAKNLVLSSGYFDFLDEIKLALQPVLEKRKNALMVNYALSTHRQKVIFSDSKTWFDHKKMDAHSFQFEHMAAMEAVTQYLPHQFLPWERLKCEALHLLIDGFSGISPWFILEAAQLYHYPARQKLRISLFTDQMETVQQFLSGFPGLTKIINLKIHPRKEALEGLHFTSESHFPADGGLPHMLFCFPDDPWDIPSDARMWRRYLARIQDRPTPIPMTFFIPGGCTTPETFKSFATEWNRLNMKIHAPEDFVTLDQILHNRTVIDAIAQALHQSYLQKNPGKPWELLSDREKDQNRRPARHLSIKLHVLGFRLSKKYEETPPSMIASSEEAFSRAVKLLEKILTEENIDLICRMEHRRWMAEKYLDQFIPGRWPTNAEERKLYKDVYRIHQDIRPFEELSEEDVEKDRNTFRNLPVLLSRLRGSYYLEPFEPGV